MNIFVPTPEQNKLDFLANNECTSKNHCFEQTMNTRIEHVIFLSSSQLLDQNKSCF